MKNKKTMQMIAFIDAICSSNGYSLEEMMYLSNEKIMNISISLILEIRELQEKGYSYDEIFELIKNMNLEDERLSNEEKVFIKEDAQKSLKIIYKKREEN